MKRCKNEKIEETNAFIYITMIIGAIIGGFLTFFMIGEIETTADIIRTFLYYICGLAAGAFVALIMLYYVTGAIGEIIESIKKRKEK